MEESPEEVPVSGEVEEHAAVVLEQVGRGGSPVRASGGGVEDNVEPMVPEISAHGRFVEKVEFGTIWREDFVAMREIFGQVASDEARSAGDEEAFRHRLRKRLDDHVGEEFLAGKEGEEVLEGFGNE